MVYLLTRFAKHRLAAFRFLVQRGTKGAAAGTIADELAIPASSLSFHLAQLERAGLISKTRHSRSLVYAADFAAMNALVGYLMENCCGGSACEADAADTPIIKRTAA